MFRRSNILFSGGIAVGFIAGAATSAARGWGSPLVMIDVVNQSGRPAQSVAVEYDSCGRRIVLPERPLASGEATQFQFSVCGEGSYLIVAHFDGGAELRGHEAYVETGYRATEVLLSHEIQSSGESFPF